MYISAFIPDVGETFFQLGGPSLMKFDFKKFPPFGDNDVDVYLKADRFRELFAGDVPKNEAAAMEDLIETAARAGG